MKKELTHSIEDYLEAIYLLSYDQKAIRITDIAQKMQVRKSSIVSAVKKLEHCGYVEHEPYGSINLTESGKNRASDVYRKHTILKHFFLEILEVPEEIAEKDACNMEHYISEKTLTALMELTEKLMKKKKDS